VALIESARRDRTIARFRFQIGAVLALRWCLRLWFAWIMVWAATGMVLRIVWQIDPRWLAWGFLGLPAAVAAAVVLARRATPSLQVVRAAFDCRGRLGGLLMADGDVEIGPWRDRFERLPAPALRWRSRRHGMMLLMASAFLGAVFLAPDRYMPARGSSALQIDAETKKLAEKLDLLKKEEILPPEKVEVLERELERVREQAQGREPAKTMESLDHLEQSFGKAAAEASESAIRQTESASGVQELALALEKARDQMDPSLLAGAMKDLAEMAKQAAAEHQALAESLSDALGDALNNAADGNGLTDEQLRKLAECLGQCKACQRGKIARLTDAKLIDAAKLRLCDKAGQCNGDALALLLGECKNPGDLDAAIACRCSKPGRGGVSRGRGDAAMIWSQGSEKENAAFKEKMLPPSAVSSLKQSRLAGITAGDPTSNKPGEASTGGALGRASAGGGAAQAQTILPEHEKTVRRYFEREKK